MVGDTILVKKKEILSPTIPKFRTYRRVFLFHQNFEKETPYEKETPFENISNLALS